MCVPGPLRGQKKTSDSLELGLQLWVAMWTLGPEPRSFARTTSAINHLVTTLVFQSIFLYGPFHNQNNLNTSYYQREKGTTTCYIYKDIFIDN